MSIAYRLPDPTQLGGMLGRLRADKGVSRSELARQVVEATGLPLNTVQSQLYRWEKGRIARPDLAAVAPILDALGYDLALVPRPAPGPGLYDADPNCRHEIVAGDHYSGVKCTKCPGWFCH